MLFDSNRYLRLLDLGLAIWLGTEREAVLEIKMVRGALQKPKVVVAGKEEVSVFPLEGQSFRVIGRWQIAINREQDRVNRGTRKAKIAHQTAQTLTKNIAYC